MAEHDEVAEQRAAKRKQKLERRQEKDDLMVLINTPAFRRWVVGLIDWCGYNSVGFVAESEGTTGLMCGMRNVALKIKADMAEVVPAAYEKMILDLTTTPNEDEDNG